MTSKADVLRDELIDVLTKLGAPERIGNGSLAILIEQMVELVVEEIPTLEQEPA